MIRYLGYPDASEDSSGVAHSREDAARKGQEIFMSVNKAVVA